VFKLYPYFTGRASDDDLRMIFADLKRRGIALALEARALTTTKACKMTAGDGGQSTINLLRRVKRLGGHVQFLAMDEPLKHGLQGDVSCRASIERVAQDVASNVRQFREVFPGLRVGDIEPVGAWKNAPTLLDDTLVFVDAYERAMGEKLAFMHADVGWTTNWLPITERLGAELRARKVPFGVIYNGEDLATSDQQWTQQAKSHFRTFENCRRPAPDDAVFQSWRNHPKRVLPETDPTTLTGVVKQYLERPRC
jgi:hypothetical protein